jgi:hypothetical protein
MQKQSETTPLRIRTRHRTKSCPFCAEDIRYEAVKCRFCGEFLRTDACDGAVRSGREAPESVEGQPDDAEKASDILWSGRPSVLALAWTTIKIGLFIAVCIVALRYPVAGLIARIPRANLSAEHVAAAERFIDKSALILIAGGALLWFWKLLAVVSIHYEVTQDRIEWSRGVFDRRVDNLDLFRVVDLKLRRTATDCLFGIGTVHLTAKDDSTPHFDFFKVRGSRDLYDILKEAALNADKEQNVVHIE